MQDGSRQDASVGRGATERHRAVARPGWVLAALLGLLLAVVGAWSQKPDPMPGRSLEMRSWADWRTALDWLRFPVESNAILRLPSAPATMLALHMAATGARVWVVGRGGSILYSDNDGVDWTAQASSTVNELFDVTFGGCEGATLAGCKGWAVGNRGTFVATENGGARWEPAPIDDELALGDLRSVAALSDKELWIASSDGKATHLGFDPVRKHWAALPSGLPPVPGLTAIRFHKGGRLGWAIGSGSLLWSADAGKTWARAEGVPKKDELTSIRFDAEGKHGFVTTRRNGIYASDDAGQRWRSLVTLSLHEDRRHGAIETTGGPTLYTNDGGKTWQAQPFDTQPANPRRVNLRGLAIASDGSRLWASDSDGSVWFGVESNGQWTWGRAATSTSTLLRGIAMDGAGKKGWAVGADGVILSTEDQGQNWADRTQGADAVALAVHGSADGRRLWVAGHSGILLASVDSGQSWQRQDTGVTSDVYDVSFLEPSGKLERGWAVTGDGEVLATVDGGLRWTVIESVAQNRLRSIHAHSDGKHLWAVGENEVLLASTDGGYNWKPQKVLRPADDGLPSALFHVHFVDTQRGWVVGGKGTLLSTTDGGATWKRETLYRSYPAEPKDPGKPLNAALRSLHVLPDGRHGWLVGDGGALWTYDPDTEHWQPRASGTQVSLQAVVAAIDDPDKVWIAGEGGVIRFTQDGGKTWKDAATVASGRTGLVMDRKGESGWAVGYPPALLKTSNYGKTWDEVDWPLRYARYPAPWFWLALLLAGAALWQALRPVRVQADEGAEAMGTTDEPTKVFADDRLDFGPLARGISRFLRNTRTEPPLTMAISGDWGSGKSSLMALVCADLRRFGSRPVWFNAWHHQNEEQLLAALLNSIRDHGLPSLLTPDGWVFRMRLLWVRSRKHFVVTLLVLLAFSALTGYLVRHHDRAEWTRLTQAISAAAGTAEAGKAGDVAKFGAISGDEYGRLVGQLLALATIGVALQRTLKAFGANPAVLAAKAASNFRLRDAAAQTSFRTRYAEQFGEVTEALPYRLVIVIDDLDRCKPESVLNVMEAVNFLVSSGRCFVLFGMSTPRVEAALSLAFERIAKEISEFDSAMPPDATAEQKERAERERRRRYVRDYLEKLVNLEITVPPTRRGQREGLLKASDESEGNAIMALGRQALALWPLWVGAATVVAGMFIGSRMQLGDSGARSVAAPAPVASAAAALRSSRQGDRLAEDVAAPAPVATLTRAAQENTQLTPARTSAADRSLRIWPVAMSLLALVVAAGGLLIYRVRSALGQTKDAPAFTDALNHWMPVVALRRSTPRAIKRFGNRLRYLAMLRQDDTPAPSLQAQLRRYWLRLTPSGRVTLAEESARAQAAAGAALEAHRLVAMGALHEVYGTDWRAALVATASDKHPAQADAAPADEQTLRRRRDLSEAVEVAIERYTKIKDVQWPPDEEECRQFEDALIGLRPITGADGAPAAAAPVRA